MGTIDTVITKENVHERDGVLIEKHRADKTVWDKLAKENPTHAVISSPDEAHAEEKSKEQIGELNASLKDGVVLDLGCGYGRVAQYLLPKRNFEGYVGVDSSYEMLQLFKNRYEKNSEEQSTPSLFVNADIHTLPLQNNTIDNVIVIAVFLHNHKSITKQSLNEIRRILKPDGRLLVYGSFPNKWSLMGLQGSLYQLYLNIRGCPFKNGPVRYYGHSEVSKLVEHFNDISVAPVGFALLPKRIIFLPGFLDSLYRRFIAVPVNALLESILPGPIVRLFPTHHDVVVKK